MNQAMWSRLRGRRRRRHGHSQYQAGNYFYYVHIHRRSTRLCLAGPARQSGAHHDRVRQGNLHLDRQVIGEGKVQGLDVIDP